MAVKGKKKLLSAPHNVTMAVDTDANWHLWGQLAVDWITGNEVLPTHIGDANGNPAIGLRKQVLDRVSKRTSSVIRTGR
jgi:hypothetical protein